MDAPRVERLADRDLDLIRPLFLDLQLGEQPHFADHPQLTREQLEATAQRIPATFRGENVIFAVRDSGAVAGFCWCVLFDPGTGLEGEVAEVIVSEQHRGKGVGEALLKAAVSLFQERGVTLGYVWTRPENAAAVRLYRGAGFSPTKQLILTWYPAG